MKNKLTTYKINVGSKNIQKTLYWSYTTGIVLQWIRLVNRLTIPKCSKVVFSTTMMVETAMSTTPVVKGNQFCFAMKTRHEIAFGPQLLVKHGHGETAALARLPNI